MTKLDGDRLVAEAKITGYLLNSLHPKGASKARFFSAYGFQTEMPESLMRAIRAHSERNEIAASEQNDFGLKTVIECHIETPDGRDPCIRSVWVRERGSSVHRFVTAYPVSS